MPRKRVLVAHPYVHPSGGGNVVAAWALQALRDQFEVTLASLGPVDLEAVNRNFGTTLREGDFRLRPAPRLYKWIEGNIPTPGALLQACIVMRWAQDLDRSERFDVLLGTQNEMDFLRPGLHYVHFPWSYLPRPDIELRWFHHIPGFLAAYRGFCRRLARTSDDGLRRNLSLANSAFVAGKIRDVHGTESIVLYPPAPGEFPEIPWERRRQAAVAVGRMNGCKRWDMAVEIVDRVRSRGLDLGLTLIAARDDPDYARKIYALASSRPWFRIMTDLRRDQLAAEVAGHRYGIHTMENEHFGIAVAEMLRAGVVPFVHDSGGPVEIVGGRAELRFRDAVEGAGRIAAVITQSPLQGDLRSELRGRRECFSATRFCQELGGLVANFRELDSRRLSP